MRRFRESNLRRLGSQMSVRIEPDGDGFLGRECPNAECEGYFKITPGTGLEGHDLPCHCPYCGHVDKHDSFWTREQIAYAKSVVVQKVRDAFHKDLKSLEFDHRPKGDFGIGMSMRVKPGHRRTPVNRYREKELETEVACSTCALRYSVYGVFAFCPDCGRHNSLQILEKNLDVVDRMLSLAADAEREISGKLIENALEDCVSAFDGFGRETCRVHGAKAADSRKAQRISFQDLARARSSLTEQFSVDLAGPLGDEEWRDVIVSFQKRHLFAHRMGVADQRYVDKTCDPHAVVGRKVLINADDVERTSERLRMIARSLASALSDAST